MSAIGATGPAPNEVNYRAVTDTPGDQEETQTELEIEAGRKEAERRAARLGIPAKKSNGAASATPSSSGDTFDTGIVVAATVQQTQNEGGKREVPLAEFSLMPKSVNGNNNVSRVIDSAKNEADFFARVLPWPLPGQPGFVNLHWFTPEHYVNGRPFTTLREFMSMAEWCRKNPHVAKEVYFCTTLQSDVGPQAKNGNYRALRSADNAIGAKSINIDVDVKDKGYKNRGDHPAGSSVLRPSLQSRRSLHLLHRYRLCLTRWQQGTPPRNRRSDRPSCSEGTVVRGLLALLTSTPFPSSRLGFATRRRTAIDATGGRDRAPLMFGVGRPCSATFIPQ